MYSTVVLADQLIGSLKTAQMTCCSAAFGLYRGSKLLSSLPLHAGFSGSPVNGNRGWDTASHNCASLFQYR